MKEIKITFDKSAAKYMFDLLVLKDAVCVGCNKKLTSNNLGAITRDFGCFCKDLDCLITLQNYLTDKK
jgi:hypothetical protein